MDNYVPLVDYLASGGEVPACQDGASAEARTRSPYRRKPCPGCPWRTDQPNQFPPAAFRRLAHTTYDMSQPVFACHESAAERPLVCAGFFLRGATHNLTVRLDRMSGAVDPSTIHDGGHELFEDYRAMAVANGVDPDDPALEACRHP